MSKTLEERTAGFQRKPHTPRWGRWLALVVALGACSVRPLAVRAQSLNVAGGASNFLNASGFQVGYQWQPVTGWLGLGAMNGVHVGGFLGTTYHGFDLGAGDRYYPFVLDTDVLDHSYIFYARGLSVSRHSARDQWLLFWGKTAVPLATPFLRAYETDRAAGAFFYERRLNSRLILHSFNILSDKSTSVHSLGFQVDPHWKVSAAAGMGRGKGFFAAATQYGYKWLAATGSYTANGEGFRRMSITNLPFSERTGGNVRVQLTPLPYLGLQLGHETVLSPILGSSKSLRATLDSASVFGSLKGFSMNAGVSASRGGAFFTNTRMFSVTRSLGSRLTTYGAILRIRTQNQKPQHLYLVTTEERLTRRLSLRETFNEGAGTKTMGWGGRFLSNPLTVGIDYQTVFNPLAGGFGGRTFVQAWTVNLQIHLPRGVTFHYDTFLDPFGHFRYTAYVNGIRYNPVEKVLEPSVAGAQPSLGRYLVRGEVQDERGNPVWGVAVQVDGQYVYSDSQGQFFLRFSRAGEYPLKVVAERSLRPGRCEVIRAPSTVRAEPEKTAQPVVIVVRCGESNSRP
jgi:hypothetical protein